jgi:hypothetical protein
MLFQDDDFVEVSSKTTGVKQMIPRVWLGQPLGADFELTPTERALEPSAKPPTIEEVLAEVGEDKALAAAALEAEQAREKPRTGLTTKLQAVVDAPPQSTTDPADGQ